MSCNWFPAKVYCFHECLLTQFWLFALNTSVCTNTEHQGNRYPAARNSASPPETFTQQLNTPGTVTISRVIKFIFERWYLVVSFQPWHSMITSSNGSIFRVTGPLWEESTGHRWIPLTKASNAELWFFSLISAWTNGWANNRRDAGDLRPRRPHHDVTVMKGLAMMPYRWQLS